MQSIYYSDEAIFEKAKYGWGMSKKALILDLDNTIYPVASIGEELFRNLLRLISGSGEHSGEFAAVKNEIMRKPFQKVAAEFDFSEKLRLEGIELLRRLAYEKPMSAFEDYEFVRKIPLPKFLVTTGFTVMQQSKVKQLEIAKDFEEIHIVDPAITTLTKRDIFIDIIQRHNFNHTELLVIGDDPDSEIKAAAEVGIDWVLYDKLQFHPGIIVPNKIHDFSELQKFL